LVAANFRVILDEREGTSPGFKFNDWEMRGVPLRIEIGPKDVAKNTVVLARRDKPGKEGKAFILQAGLLEAVAQTLDSIQKSLYERALNFRNAHTVEPKDFEEFKSAVENGFAYSFWCGDAQCEKNIKEKTKATLRCIPLEQPDESGTCIECGRPAQKRAYFAKAY
jgi:prolyl-tRNA synthetase